MPDFPVAMFESGLPMMPDPSIFNVRRGNYGLDIPAMSAQQAEAKR